MSTIEKVRKAYKTFKEEIEGFTFTEPETCDLLCTLANHILKNDIDEVEDHPPENYMKLIDFTNKYIFAAPATILRYCQQRDDFRQSCAIQHKGRWYIHENKAIEYLSKIPRFKTRIERGFFSGNLSR